uniref:Uncharacterized protein n=1 Tax=Heterorhabditis bacteriophora TaxID=37862 RepID=A0A1I7X592_HETBA
MRLQLMFESLSADIVRKCRLKYKGTSRTHKQLHFSAFIFQHFSIHIF